MVRLPDGPLGPKLIAEGFIRLGDLGDASYRSAPNLTAEELFIVGAACSSIAIKRNRLTDLPIFVNVGNLMSLTVFVDVRGQIWFARETVDLSTWGVDNLAKLE